MECLYSNSMQKNKSCPLFVETPGRPIRVLGFEEPRAHWRTFCLGASNRTHRSKRAPGALAAQPLRRALSPVCGSARLAERASRQAEQKRKCALRISAETEAFPFCSEKQAELLFFWPVTGFIATPGSASNSSASGKAMMMPFPSLSSHFATPFKASRTW